ncbi:MAG: hypothetical protein HY532_05000 [Chloroflexi bacterium]|nr:hypothetical protein [Chloroflexota bacterium]
MPLDPSKVGIYFSAKEKKVVRITSPYWVPEPPDWVMVTNAPNETLTRVRELIKEKNLLGNPSDVTWGTLPVQE